jgi:hypothetical protein
MNLERERIIFISFENQLTEDTKLLGETRRYEQVKLAEGKCVCRTFLITRAEVHVGEPLYLQTGCAAWHLVVVAVIGGMTSRRALRTRGNCRACGCSLRSLLLTVALRLPGLNLSDSRFEGSNLRAHLVDNFTLIARPIGWPVD